MPKEIEQRERQLRAAAKKQGLSGNRADAYVYGTMRKMGWEPGKSHFGRSPGKRDDLPYDSKRRSESSIRKPQD